MKYKLDVTRDVDTDEPDNFILNLISGWKFSHDQFQTEHVRGYDSMQELKEDVKHYVVKCDCHACQLTLVTNK